MIRIAQISDCHLFADASQTSYGQISPYLSLTKVLQNIALRPIDLLLVTGDLSADGSAASYKHFQKLLIENGINSQFVILPGNHDDLAMLQQQFARDNLWLHYPPERPLTLNRWQIHLLNTKTSDTSGYLSNQDLSRLTHSLQQHQHYFQLVAAHHHPLPCDSWMDVHGWKNGAQLVDALQNIESVKAMVYGHIHAANEHIIDACFYLSCPSTCWQWAMQAEFGLSELAPGYRLLNLTESGQLTSEIIRVEYG